MQRKAAEDLKKLVTDALVDAGLVYEGAKALRHAAPPGADRRGLPARWPDLREESKGPRVGAPEPRSTASSRRGAHLDRSGQDRDRPEEGRVLRRPYRASKGADATTSSPTSLPKVIIRASPGRNRCAGAPAG